MNWLALLLATPAIIVAYTLCRIAYYISAPRRYTKQEEDNADVI